MLGRRPTWIWASPTPNTMIIVHGDGLVFRKFSEEVILEFFPISMPLQGPCTAH